MACQLHDSIVERPTIPSPSQGRPVTSPNRNVGPMMRCYTKTKIIVCLRHIKNNKNIQYVHMPPPTQFALLQNTPGMSSSTMTGKSYSNSKVCLFGVSRVDTPTEQNSFSVLSRVLLCTLSFLFPVCCL